MSRYGSSWRWLSRRPVERAYAAELKRADRLLCTAKPAEWRKGASILHRAASDGSVWAQYRLGLCYEHGGGVPRHYRRAREWYKKAAEAGFDSAQLNLGIMVAEGRGGAADQREALRLQLLSAQ